MTRWRVVAVLLLVAAVGCTSSEGGTTTPGAVPTSREPGTIPFHLDVTNQSFDVPKVRLVIAIDGDLIIDDNFDVGTQHTVVRYDFFLTPGEHTVTVQAPYRGLQDEFSFTLSEELFAIMSFWPEEAPSGLMWNTAKEPFPVF